MLDYGITRGYFHLRSSDIFFIGIIPVGVNFYYALHITPHLI